MKYAGLLMGSVALAMAIIGGNLFAEVFCAGGVGFSLGIIVERRRIPKGGVE